jgi:hypothetical protein
MTLDRRTFIVGTGIVAMAPAFEPWALPAASASAADIHHVEFAIDGWSPDDGSTASTPVWIKLDRSWRAAWR